MSETSCEEEARQGEYMMATTWDRWCRLNKNRVVYNVPDGTGKIYRYILYTGKLIGI